MGDASRGSLSSYAYIIMMIYYLQQCDPPVLPVLQEVSYVICWPVLCLERTAQLVHTSDVLFYKIDYFYYVLLLHIFDVIELLLNEIADTLRLIPW